MKVVFEWARVGEPELDANGNVVSLMIGLRAYLERDPTISAYIDERVEVPSYMRKPIDQLTEDEIRAFAFQHAVKEVFTETPEGREFQKENWFAMLARQIRERAGLPRVITTLSIDI